MALSQGHHHQRKETTKQNKTKFTKRKKDNCNEDFANKLKPLQSNCRYNRQQQKGKYFVSLPHYIICIFLRSSRNFSVWQLWNTVKLFVDFSTF
jgi:hypothetical protein